jgi:hypothetical protein
MSYWLRAQHFSCQKDNKFYGLLLGKHGYQAIFKDGKIKFYVWSLTTAAANDLLKGYYAVGSKDNAHFTLTGDKRTVKLEKIQDHPVCPQITAIKCNGTQDIYMDIYIEGDYLYLDENTFRSLSSKKELSYDNRNGHLIFANHSTDPKKNIAEGDTLAYFDFGSTCSTFRWRFFVGNWVKQ